MVDPGALQKPRLVAEALGTRAIPAEIAAIPKEHSRTVGEYETDYMPEVRSGQVVHPFLAKLVSEVELVPVL